MIFLIISALILLIVGFFFVGKPPQAKEITWGVNFSQKHATNLGLDWKETYLALLDDLKVKNIKLITHWDLIEPTKDGYVFDDLDWQVGEVKRREGKIILVIGMKTGRWPECHIPDWAKNLKKEEQQKEILGIIEKIVLRYGDSQAIRYWQVENEPFFPFGECPWMDKEFLKKEIDLVKSLDYKKRPVVISDSGELSLWFGAAKFGDLVGTTMHRKVWFKEFKKYVDYPFPPVYYWRRAQIIKKLFSKEVICVELQLEPWCPRSLYDCSIEEQQKTMNLEKFKENVKFAKETGFDTFYLWGAEWMYLIKEKQGLPEIWEEAKKLF